MKASWPKSLSLVLELLIYEPQTGVFVWRKNRTFTAKAGSIAGSLDANGYIKIKLNGKQCLAHRLAWIISHEKIPEGMEIDHINGKRDDNRLSNLRLVNAMQQRANAKLNSDNTSGYRGVYWNKRLKKWRAHIQREHLGYFNDKELAAAAYRIEFDKRYGSEFWRAS